MFEFKEGKIISLSSTKLIDQQLFNRLNVQYTTSLNVWQIGNSKRLKY